MPRFRLLVGTHIDKDPQGNVRTYRAFTKDDVVESHESLDEKYNSNDRGKLPKFQRLDEFDAAIRKRGKVWDPEAETLDEFGARMRSEQQKSEQGSKDKPQAALTASVESLKQTDHKPQLQPARK